MNDTFFTNWVGLLFTTPRLTDGELLRYKWIANADYASRLLVNTMTPPLFTISSDIKFPSTRVLPIYTTQPTGSDLTSGQILGTQPLADTTSVVPIWTSGQTSLQWLHILAAIFALLNVLSLFVPPRWINGGKGKVADFQRSGILTLVLSVISMIFTIVAFACIFTIVLNGKSALNAIEGISAKWPSSAAFWVSFSILSFLFFSFPYFLNPSLRLPLFDALIINC